MSSKIMWFIQWILVPGVLALIFLYGLFLPKMSLNAKAKAAGKAGILAGLIIFVLFIISEQAHVIEFSSDVLTVELTGLSLLLLIAGFCIGFLVKWLLKIIFETRILGVLVLIIVAATTITSYSFFFIKKARGSVMFASLAILLGAFVYRMVFPEELVTANKSQKLEEVASTPDGLLRSLTKVQRMKSYLGFRDYLEWTLKRQGEMGSLAKVEEIIAGLETHFKEKVKTGEFSADEADDIKSYQIWVIAHQESRSAPIRIALWEAAKKLPGSIQDYDKIFTQCRESIKLEFAEKLRQFVNLDEP